MRARHEARNRLIGDGLILYKKKTRLTNVQLGKQFGIGHEKIAEIMDGKDVKLSLRNVWRLMDIAGLEIKRRNSADNQDSA